MKSKRYLAFVLAIFMALSVPVYAEETEETAETTEAAEEESTDTAEETDEAAESTLPQGDWVIGMANGYFGNTWRAQYVASFEEKCEEYKQAGIIADYYCESTNADATEQLNQVNDLIQKGCDAICVNAVSASAMMPVITACQRAGVLCVIATDPVGIDDSIVEVLVDNEALYYIMTEWLCEKLDGSGRIVKITGTPGMPATQVRQTVADEVLSEFPDIEVVAEAPGSWSQTEAQSAMSTILSTYTDIDAVLTEDVMGEGIMRAYETAGEELPLMTGDYVMSFFRKWEETGGDHDFCVTTFQPQAAADAVAYAVRVLNGYELDYELQPNSLNHDIVNAIKTPPSYCVTLNGVSEEEQGESWTSYEGVSYISLAEALEIGADLDDTEAIGKSIDEATWDTYFK